MVELTIVIMILGVLSMMAVPKYQISVEKSGERGNRHDDGGDAKGVIDPIGRQQQREKHRNKPDPEISETVWD